MPPKGRANSPSSPVNSFKLQFVAQFTEKAPAVLAGAFDSDLVDLDDLGGAFQQDGGDHAVLNIVVGLEFVRMLIDMTPANTLEVLIMATARQIIMNHDSTTTLLIGIICIAILFAVRRFLIPRSDLTLDLVELD